MAQGKLVFSRAIFSCLLPEVLETIMRYMKQGKGEASLCETREEYVYTLDHPDFLEMDPPCNYVLHFKRVYDAASNSERPVISRLSLYDERMFKVRTVRDYL